MACLGTELSEWEKLLAWEGNVLAWKTEINDWMISFLERGEILYKSINWLSDFHRKKIFPLLLI